MKNLTRPENGGEINDKSFYQFTSGNGLTILNLEKLQHAQVFGTCQVRVTMADGTKFDLSATEAAPLMEYLRSRTVIYATASK